jgi:hypothetical protein
MASSRRRQIPSLAGVNPPISGPKSVAHTSSDAASRCQLPHAPLELTHVILDACSTEGYTYSRCLTFRAPPAALLHRRLQHAIWSGEEDASGRRKILWPLLAFREEPVVPNVGLRHPLKVMCAQPPVSPSAYLILRHRLPILASTSGSWAIDRRGSVPRLTTSYQTRATRPAFSKSSETSTWARATLTKAVAAIAKLATVIALSSVAGKSPASILARPPPSLDEPSRTA